MKVFFGVLLLVAASPAEEAVQSIVPEEELTAFNYHERFGIAEAARIKKAEDMPFRIVGGSASGLGEFPYQAGLVITMNSGSTSVCGASLVTNTRLLSAAHCWWDGKAQANLFTVVLGSTHFYTGGTRIATRDVEIHESYNPRPSRNDLAIIRIPWTDYGNNFHNIALPFGLENQAFDNQWCVASGFGFKADGAEIANNQYLSHVWLNVITNNECAETYGNTIQPTNICTSGIGGVGTCGGDSGGPLACDWGNLRYLVGITAFVSALGCEIGKPAAFTRVTTYLSWIQPRL